MNFYNFCKIDLSTIFLKKSKLKADVRKKKILCVETNQLTCNINTFN